MKLLFSFGDRWFWRVTLMALLLGVLALNLWGISPRPASAAAFDVDTTNDDPAASACTAAPNDCSLRGAITAVGLLPGADTINVPSGTYTLVGSELALDSDISLIGAGAASTFIQANLSPNVATYRVMNITNSATVTISGVTIRHGVADNGGGIYNRGGMTITGGTVITANAALDSGGGIYNESTIHVIPNVHMLITNETIITGNTAVQNGGGVFNDEGSLMSIRNGVTVSNNTAGLDGGGLINFNGLTVVESVVTGNSAGRNGGGISNGIVPSHTYGGSVTIGRTTLSDNTANVAGGGLYNDGNAHLNNCIFSGNRAPNEPGGGAIFDARSLNNISACTFVNNQGYHGGAINGGGYTMFNTLFAGNTATGDTGNGGAIYTGSPLACRGCTFANNSTIGANSEGGGAIYWLGRTDGQIGNRSLMLWNSTLSGNSTTGLGGAIFYRADILYLEYVTLTNNTALGGGGLYFEASPDVSNTIIANNHANSGADCAGLSMAMNSLDYNLIRDTNGCPIGGTTTHNITGIDPLLGPLQDNGGLTPTHMLLAGSPAIDAGDNAVCAAAGINYGDQRGIRRPTDGNGDGVSQCDIGSVEAEGIAPPSEPTLSINSVTVTEGDTGTVNAVFTVTRSGSTDETSTVGYTTADDTATVTDNDYVTATGTLTFAPNETAQQITVVINGDTIDEGTSEQFVVNLSNPTAAVIQQSQGISTITDDDGIIILPDDEEGGSSEEDHARAQAPLCSLIGGGTNPIVRADVLGGTVTDGSVFCRIIAQNSQFVTGPEEIGNADVIALGVLQAVDVFGLRNDGTAEAHFNAAVKTCLQGTGRLFYLDATTYPRALSQLPTTSELGYTCGLIFNAGTVVLVP